MASARTPSTHSKFTGGYPLRNVERDEKRKAFGPRVIWLTGIFCGSRVLGTDMRCELLVELLSEVGLHLVNGFANERP